MNKNCHICKSKNLHIFKPKINLKQVTSDCRPWNRELILLECTNCHTVQKLINNEWIKDSEEIYSKYQVYAQAEGQEQHTFDSSTGNGVGRSQQIVNWISENVDLKKEGKLLDIGCGNGSFLKTFQNDFNSWKLTGLELDYRNEEKINSIPNTTLLVEDIKKVKEKYDLIVLIHALEHIINPAEFLNTISKLLNPNGLLFIEIPNFKLAPFDILIADHCSHFTTETLKNLLTSNNFNCIKITEDFIPKEITLVAKYTNNQLFLDRMECDNSKLINDYFNNIYQIWEQANNLNEPFGIFGTSISATWLASEFINKVDFFIDEDIGRVGKIHLGKKIYAINNCPNNMKILMPLRFDIAKKIKNRLEVESSKNMILPPM